MEKYLEDFWRNYSYIHNSTKELFILSEEYDTEMSSFIQPIKEQKDSLEHIVRAYSRYSQNECIKSEDEKYIKSNLTKAMGHIFRAFFDCADVFSIIFWEKISNEIRKFSYNEILRVWKDYEKYRIVLVDMPKKIAEFRTNKDIAKNDGDITGMVKSYKETVFELFKIYDEFMKDIYPILNK